MPPPAPQKPVRPALPFGSAQSGRFLREFLYQSFNYDEAGRRVFDGVLSHIAGAARLDLTRRRSTPREQAMYHAVSYPFADTAQPATRADGRPTARRRAEKSGFPSRPQARLLGHRRMHLPVNIQLIGQEVAIAWDDGRESYYTFEQLRAASPSAANIGERDILGNQYGGDGPKRFTGVQVLGWEQVGNYALRFDFSDGHRTGLYSFDYLRVLAAPA